MNSSYHAKRNWKMAIFWLALVLGESPGTSRLDGGFGVDHRAVYGTLVFDD